MANQLSDFAQQLKVEQAIQALVDEHGLSAVLHGLFRVEQKAREAENKLADQLRSQRKAWAMNHAGAREPSHD